jgi:aminoglycoside phosphotransferase (APT) family kinase protein
VASGHLRDLEQLREGLARWWSERDPSVDHRTISITRPTAGLSNETLVVTLGTAGGIGPGRRVVVRLPPVEPSFPDYDLAMQAAVQRAVAAAGVAAPVPVTLEDDARWLGAPFLVMPFVEGHVPGQAPVLDRWVTGSAPGLQRRLHDRFVDTLAAIHRVDWCRSGLGEVLRGGDGTLADEVRWWTGYLGWSGADAALPRLATALEWCSAHLPGPTSAPSLLWGDPRLGNLVMTDARQVAAVLDWELATLGAPEMDLGWYLALDAVMSELLGRRVPGFPDRAGTVARYEARSGRAVAHLEWHEIFALTRALAISTCQARIARGAGVAYPEAGDGGSPMMAIIERRIADWR